MSDGTFTLDLSKNGEKVGSGSAIKSTMLPYAGSLIGTRCDGFDQLDVYDGENKCVVQLRANEDGLLKLTEHAGIAPEEIAWVKKGSNSETMQAINDDELDFGLLKDGEDRGAIRGVNGGLYRYTKLLFDTKEADATTMELPNGNSVSVRRADDQEGLYKTADPEGLFYARIIRMKSGEYRVRIIDRYDPSLSRNADGKISDIGDVVKYLAGMAQSVSRVYFHGVKLGEDEIGMLKERGIKLPQLEREYTKNKKYLN